MKNLYLLLILIILGSCNSTKKTNVNTNDTMKNATINYRLINKGTLHGNGREGIKGGSYIIKDNKSWLELAKKMGNVTKMETEKGLNFKKETVLAIFAPVLGSGGTSISIDKIIQTDENIEVYVKYVSKGGMQIMVMNQPYLLVAIPTTDMPIDFIISKK